MVSPNESNLFVYDERFVSKLAVLFEADRTQCQPITYKDLHARPLAERLLDASLRRSARALEAATWLAVGVARRLG